MTITHHPSAATLAAFASGTLDEARALVVAAHLSLCQRCREDVRAFEEVGGALLDEIEPAALGGDSLRRASERLDAHETAIAGALSDAVPVEAGFPAPLAHYPLGPWRWIGRGVQWRSVGVPALEESRVFMLKAEPGTRLPHHRHIGTEWTCVFEGAFRHGHGRFGPGDFDEADETVEHRPVLEDEGPCICLIAMQGGIALQGWLGRLMQPFVRI